MRAVDATTLRRLRAAVMGVLGPDGEDIINQISESFEPFPAEFPVLTPYGRLILFVMEFPGASIPELALWLGVSETHTSRLMHDLTTKRVVRRTKWGRKYGYEVDTGNVLKQPDIIRLVAALGNHLTESDVSPTIKESDE